MHPISDKELDKLFQKGFEGAEIEPSEGLWSQIAEKMEPAKPKKSFPVFWMAAASVLVVLSAGFYFNRNTEVIKLQGTKQHLANNTEAVPQQSVTVNQVQDELTTVSTIATTVDRPTTRQTVRNTYQPVDPEPQPADLVEPEETIVTVNTNPVKLLVSNPMKGVNVPDRYYGDQSLLDVTQTDMTINAADNQSTEETLAAQNAPASRKIRSIGTLVNYVVAKVDKRESKIIEFKDSEEGSEVSGVNLGLLKLKSKK